MSDRRVLLETNESPFDRSRLKFSRSIDPFAQPHNGAVVGNDSGHMPVGVHFCHEKKAGVGSEIDRSAKHS
jgi:hypothetical protein